MSDWKPKKYYNTGRVAEWGKDLTPEQVKAMEGGEEFLLLKEDGRPHSYICKDSYNEIKELLIEAPRLLPCETAVRGASDSLKSAIKHAEYELDLPQGEDAADVISALCEMAARIKNSRFSTWADMRKEFVRAIGKYSSEREWYRGYRSGLCELLADLERE